MDEPVHLQLPHTNLVTAAPPTQSPVIRPTSAQPATEMETRDDLAKDDIQLMELPPTTNLPHANPLFPSAAQTAREPIQTPIVSLTSPSPRPRQSPSPIKATTPELQMVSSALELAMRRIRLGKHTATTHATHPKDEAIRQHLKQVRRYNLAVLEALAQHAHLITANDDLCKTNRVTPYQIAPTPGKASSSPCHTTGA